MRRVVFLNVFYFTHIHICIQSGWSGRFRPSECVQEGHHRQIVRDEVHVEEENQTEKGVCVSVLCV